MPQFYPELIPTPYDDLLSGAERADIWRVLVLHKVSCVGMKHHVCILGFHFGWSWHRQAAMAQALGSGIG
jgi:hypothetical protein